MTEPGSQPAPYSTDYTTPSPGTTTAPAAPAAQNTGTGVSMAVWSDIGTRMRSTFDTYEATMQAAYEDDQADMTAEEDRMREQFEGDSCDDTEEDLRNFKADVEEVWNEAKQYFTDFRTEYSSTFQPYEQLAKQMDDRRKTWEQDVLPKFGGFDETLRQSQIGQHWKGKAGESYRKQLGPQSTAMTDIKVSAANAQVSMVTSSNLQQVIYNSIRNSVMDSDTTVSGLPTPSLTDDVWAERIYAMRDINRGLLEWLRDFSDEYSTPWGTMQDDMIGQLTEAREGNQELTQYQWPAATAESSGYVPTYTGGGQGAPPASTNQPGQSTGGDQSGQSGAGGATPPTGGGQTADEETYE